MKIYRLSWGIPVFIAAFLGIGALILWGAGLPAIARGLVIVCVGVGLAWPQLRAGARAELDEEATLLR